jgi:hypothetical protein
VVRISVIGLSPVGSISLIDGSFVNYEQGLRKVQFSIPISGGNSLVKQPNMIFGGEGVGANPFPMLRIPRVKANFRITRCPNMFVATLAFVVAAKPFWSLAGRSH